MPHRARLLCLTVLAAVLAGGCAHVPGQKQMLSDLTDEIGRTYAPDRRTALWETQVQKQGGELILTGLTDRPEALEALRTAAAREDLDARIDVRLLPDASVSEKPWALVSVPAASLTGKPAFAAALTTQAVLGTPLRVLERQRPFTRV